MEINGEGRPAFMSWSDNMMLNEDKAASSRKYELRDSYPKERTMQRERDFLGRKEHSLMIECLGWRLP